LLPHVGQHPPHTTNRGHAHHAHSCRYRYSTGAPGTGLTIGHGLAAAGLHRDRERNRIVAEKPLGNDLASFRDIIGVMTRCFTKTGSTASITVRSVEFTWRKSDGEWYGRDVTVVVCALPRGDTPAGITRQTGGSTHPEVAETNSGA
jgi:hypothetical protein